MGATLKWARRRGLLDESEQKVTVALQQPCYEGNLGAVRGYSQADWLPFLNASLKGLAALIAPAERDQSSLSRVIEASFRIT